MEMFLAVLGILIAWKTFHSKPIEEKENLLINYKMNQMLSLEVQGLIQKYIEEKMWK